MQRTSSFINVGSVFGIFVLGVFLQTTGVVILARSPDQTNRPVDSASHSARNPVKTSGRQLAVSCAIHATRPTSPCTTFGCTVSLMKYEIFVRIIRLSFNNNPSYPSRRVSLRELGVYIRPTIPVLQRVRYGVEKKILIKRIWKRDVGQRGA